MFTAYPLLWLSLAFLAGVVVADRLPSATAWEWATVGAFALFSAIILAHTKARRYALALAFIAAFAAGAARLAFSRPELASPHFIATYADSKAPAKVVGTLTAPPDRRPTYANLTIAVDYIRFGDQPAIPVKGKVLVRVPPEEAVRLRYGDKVVAVGMLQTPPSGGVFDYRAYLARRGIFVEMRPRRVGVIGHSGNPILRAIYALRERAHMVVLRIWPGASAALLSGILLGLDNGIPAAVYDAFRRTGTAHIIAISGFNITILAGLFISLFGRILGERKGTVMAALAIISYTVLVGADAAVVRAALMGLIGMLALQTGRRQHAYTTLAFTAALMALLTPNVLWDIGFQLSFAATWGLVRFADPLQRSVEHLLSLRMSPAAARRLSAPMGEFLLFTLAAQAATLPISAYHFKQVSVISLLANPAILPVQAPLMIGAGIAVLLGLVWLPIGRAAGLFVLPLAEYTIRAVQWFGSLPLTTASVVNVSLAGIAAYYVSLIGLPALWEKRHKLHIPPLAVSKTAVLVGLTVAAALVWHPVFARPDGYLHITLLPVGNGEAVLLRSPSGGWVLLDGGENSRELLAGLGKRVHPSKGALDWLVVGNTGEESAAALPDLLKIYAPQQVWWAGDPKNSAAAKLVWGQLQATGVPVHGVVSGSALNLGKGARLKALTVSQRGAVFLLKWGRFRAIFPLGEDFDALASLSHLAPRLRPLSALMLAESGYFPLNPPQTVWALYPRLLLLSVRLDDPHGRPSLELLQALGGMNLLRTDICGALSIITDGKRMWAHSERRCAATTR